MRKNTQCSSSDDGAIAVGRPRGHFRGPGSARLGSGRPLLHCDRTVSRMRHCIVILASVVVALAVPSLASASDTFTPVTASVLGKTRPAVRGTDGRYHVVYELVLTNTKPAPATIDSVTVRDARRPARVLARYSGSRLVQSLRTLQPGRVENAKLEPNGSRLFFVQLSYKRRAAVPHKVIHTLSVDAAGDPATTTPTPQRYDVAPYTISTQAPVVLGPPVRGPGWVVTNGCCTGVHREQVQSINGNLYDGQRYAIDWMRLDAQGRMVSGDPHDVRSYTCYGDDVLAVAGGRVVSTLNTLSDQVPGRLPDPSSFPTVESIDGNGMILDIGHGRFVFYGHMQHGSVTVKPGERVHRGQLLGKVGNSGNTSAPHLHIQVMDGPSTLGSDGLPFTFDHVSVSGQIDAHRWETAPSVEGVWRAGAAPAGKPHTKELPLDLNIVDFP